MSRSLRPVTVKWGEASSVFISSEDAVALFEWVAAAVNSQSSVHEDSDWTEVWIETGKAFLDFLVSPAFTIETAREHIDLTDEDSELRETTDDDLKALVGNMKILAAGAWRQSVNSHDGELRFYID